MKKIIIVSIFSDTNTVAFIQVFIELISNKNISLHQPKKVPSLSKLVPKIIFIFLH